MVLNSIKRSIICRILQDGMEENLANLILPSVITTTSPFYPLTHAVLEFCIRELIDGDVYYHIHPHQTQPAYEDQDMNAVPPFLNDSSGARR